MQMGDPTEPFRELGSARPRSRELGDFNFSAYETADDELGGFNFDMGCHKDKCSHGTDSSTAAIYDVEAFFELSDAARAFCTSASYGTLEVEAGNDIAGYGSIGEAGNYDARTFFEVGDDSRLDWVSPRISFSQDLTMAEFDASCSSRGSPKKGNRQEGAAENGDPHYGSSSEFEFLSTGVIITGFTPDSKDVMISAEELFSDGKLLPMHIHEKACPNGELNKQSREVGSFHVQPQTVELSSNEPFVDSSQLTFQESHADGPNSKAAHHHLTARHLSIELPRAHPSSIMCISTPQVSGSVDNSPCSSPPRSSVPPANAPAFTSTTLHKASSKYSFRIKDFFKPKRMTSSSVNPQLTRDNSTTTASTCRIPIPPRTFWPFSRSNSAGESKTGTPLPPMLPPRSNSAGESNTSRVATALKKSDEAPSFELNKTSNIRHSQDVMGSANEDEIDTAKTRMDASSNEDCIEAGSLRQYSEDLNQASVEEKCVPSTSSHKSSVRLNKGKASGSPGRATRKRYMYSTANFLRGSPGRRGGTNSFVKVNTGRIVLKNLERCSADRKLCRETSGRRAVAYPVALRVSPVLNVALYRGGKVPSSGMFGLRSLFTSKKAKDKDAAMNNWRAGA